MVHPLTSGQNKPASESLCSQDYKRALNNRFQRVTAFTARCFSRGIRGPLGSSTQGGLLVKRTKMKSLTSLDLLKGAALSVTLWPSSLMSYTSLNTLNAHQTTQQSGGAGWDTRSSSFILMVEREWAFKIVFSASGWAMLLSWWTLRLWPGPTSKLH